MSHSLSPADQAGRSVVSGLSGTLLLPLFIVDRVSFFCVDGVPLSHIRQAYAYLDCSKQAHFNTLLFQYSDLCPDTLYGGNMS